MCALSFWPHRVVQNSLQVGGKKRLGMHFKGFFEDSLRVLWGFFEGSLMIHWGFFEDSLRILWGFFEDSWRIFERFLEDSWRIFEGFSEDSWKICGGFFELTIDETTDMTSLSAQIQWKVFKLFIPKSDMQYVRIVYYYTKKLFSSANYQQQALTKTKKVSPDFEVCLTYFTRL